jgi:hypothetical protein
MNHGLKSQELFQLAQCIQVHSLLYVAILCLLDILLVIQTFTQQSKITAVEYFAFSSHNYMKGKNLRNEQLVYHQ